MAGEQFERHATLSLSVEKGKLELESFQAVERLSEPFVITVEAVCKDGQLDLLPSLGKPATIRLSDEGETVRTFHALLWDAAFLERTAYGYRYRLTLRPWLYLLSQTLNYRIYQDKTPLDVIKDVFSKGGWKDVDYEKLSGSFLARSYCVQFRESDFDFVSRLMEEEGIYYHFEHGDDAHKLVLCNAPGSHSAVKGLGPVPFNPPSDGRAMLPNQVASWNERVATTGQQLVTLRNFSFTTPDPVRQGFFRGPSEHPQDALEVYDYPARGLNESDAQALGKTMIEASRVQRRVFHGETNVGALGCGKLFTLSQHETGRYNREYLITGLVYSVTAQQFHSGGGSGFGDVVAVEAIPSSTPFRAPLRTPRPVARGPQTATVTGPDEPKKEEIHTDEQGRVLVRFHWDRSDTKDAESSCWIRVASSWAGPTMGEIFLPRVGHEVIVDFLDGNPDRPIVTGRAYTNKNMGPAVLPGAKTVSGWKTQTVYGKANQDYDGAVDPPTDEAGYNSIAFDDQSGGEMVHIRAQRDMVVNVFRDETHVTHRDRKDRVGRNQTTIVQTGDESHTVETGGRTTTIQKDETLSVKDGDMKTTVEKGNYALNVDLGSVLIEAMQKIELKVGQSSIEITQEGITIKAPVNVEIKSDVQTTVKGSVMTQIGSDAAVKVQAPMITLN